MDFRVWWMSAHYKQDKSRYRYPFITCGSFCLDYVMIILEVQYSIWNTSRIFFQHLIRLLKIISYDFSSTCDYSLIIVRYLWSSDVLLHIIDNNINRKGALYLPGKTAFKCWRQNGFILRKSITLTHSLYDRQFH